MSAKRDDWSRLQEIHDVIIATQSQMQELSFSEQRFLHPKNAQDDLIAEGILNRVLRVTEEAGHVSEAVAKKYGFDRQGVLGVRNRLAHAYGEIDRDIVWSVIQDDFEELLEACKRFCEDNGIEME